MNFRCVGPILSLPLVLALACATEHGQADDDVGGTSEDTASEGTSDADATGDGTTEGPTHCTPELESLRVDIFAKQCTQAGCHAGAQPAADLDLSLDAPALEAELVGVAGAFCEGTVRVIPQQPEASLLYTKVAGPVPCGEPMPFGGELDDAAKACIFDWISQLEPLNCETCGGDACVDFQTDASHCGDCGTTCPNGIACVAGACACPNGEEICGDACIDENSDPTNCGDCGNACGPAKVCWQGICADTCADLTACDGACVDTQTDPNNCGSCGNACAMGSACTNGGCDCAGDGVSFAAEVQPIFTNRCTGIGCHRPPTNAGSLNLTTGNAYADLVGVPSSQCGNLALVEPGQPGASYLMNKVQGVDLCFGTKMPKTGAMLTADQIATISEWICRGAQDD